MSSSYEVGSVARVTLNFMDIDGVAVDPATVVITITRPSGEVVTHSGADVVNDPAAVGRWYCDHTIAQIGVHHAKGVSTGPAAAASTIFASIA